MLNFVYQVSGGSMVGLMRTLSSSIIAQKYPFCRLKPWKKKFQLSQLRSKESKVYFKKVFYGK